MVVILLFALYFASQVGFALTRRKCADFVCDDSIVSKAVFLLVNCTMSLIFFWLLAGCRIYTDWKLVGLSAIFALICIGTNISGLYALKYCLAASATSVQSGGNMIIASTLGFLLWQEEATLSRIVAIAMMLAAIYFIYKEAKGEKKQDAPLGKRLLFLGLTAVFAALTTVINKFFVEICGDAEQNSYCFYCNVFMIAFCLVYLAVYCAKKSFPKAEIREFMQPKRLGLLTGNSVIGNLGTVAMLPLLALVDVAVFSTVSTSMGILSGVAVSVMLRQKMTKFTYLSVALAIAAVVLQAL